MEDLSYRGVFVSHWKELRKGAFHTDSIMTYLDNTIEYLGDAIDRNFTRWPIIGHYVWPNYFIGESYDGRGRIYERMDNSQGELDGCQYYAG